MVSRKVIEHFVTVTSIKKWPSWNQLTF